MKKLLMVIVVVVGLVVPVMGGQAYTNSSLDKYNKYKGKKSNEHNSTTKYKPSGTRMPDRTVPATQAVIESRVDGAFEGWEGETIVKLMNGQIWQQTHYHYHYHYAYMPNVLVYNSGVGWKMKVEGIEDAISVTRLK